MENEGLVRGLPKFRLYRQFVEDLDFPFRRVKIDEAKERELVDRIEQLKQWHPKTFDECFESFKTNSKVVEVRHYGYSGMVRYEVVEYVGACLCASTSLTHGVHIIVQYDRDGKLTSYTFPYRDPEPMRTEAWLTGLPQPWPSHLEDVIDYMCDEERFTGLFVNPVKSRSAINVCYGVKDSEWELEWWPYGLELFRIAKNVGSLFDSLEFVKTYMRYGTSDALALYDDWEAVWKDEEWKPSDAPREV